MEVRRTYDFLTCLHAEFEPLRAQLFARHPGVSLMDALAAAQDEETCLRTAGLLQSASVLAARSISRSTTAPPAVSSASAPSGGTGGGGLHCDHCGRDGHVLEFCFKRKKEQARARRSSQGSGGSGTAGSQRSSSGSETQEFLRLLSRLVASARAGAAGSVTQSSAPTGSATASQSSV